MKINFFWWNKFNNKAIKHICLLSADSSWCRLLKGQLLSYQSVYHYKRDALCDCQALNTHPVCLWLRFSFVGIWVSSTSFNWSHANRCKKVKESEASHDCKNILQTLIDVTQSNFNISILPQRDPPLGARHSAFVWGTNSWSSPRGCSQICQWSFLCSFSPLLLRTRRWDLVWWESVIWSAAHIFKSGLIVNALDICYYKHIPLLRWTASQTLMKINNTNSPSFIELLFYRSCPMDVF